MKSEEQGKQNTLDLLWETRDAYLIWPHEVWVHMVVFKQGGCQSDKYLPWMSSSFTFPDLSASCIVVSIKPTEQLGKHWWWIFSVCVNAKIRSLILGSGILSALQNDIFHSHKYGLFIEALLCARAPSSLDRILSLQQLVWIFFFTFQRLILVCLM